jgi:1-deoxy-D-xylulose-5-phosphate synthase
LLDIGKGEIIHKSQIPNPKSKTNPKSQIQNSKLCIISIGSMVYPSVEAAKILEKEGVAAIVINARFVKPLDRELIVNSVKNANFVVTVEEGCLEGGFGSAVLELLSEEGVSKPVKCIGLPDKFIEHGKRAQILEIYGLNPQGIAESIKSFISK